MVLGGGRGYLKLFSVLEINNLRLLTVVTMVCKKSSNSFLLAHWSLVLLGQQLPSSPASSVPCVTWFVLGSVSWKLKTWRLFFFLFSSFCLYCPSEESNASVVVGSPRPWLYNLLSTSTSASTGRTPHYVLDCLNPCRTNMADRIRGNLKGAFQECQKS